MVSCYPEIETNPESEQNQRILIFGV